VIKANSSVDSQGYGGNFQKNTPRKTNPAMIEKSKKLKRIYEEKDSLEKQYGGEAVRAMSPINHVNG
jgi:hypothetical protein